MSWSDAICRGFLLAATAKGDRGAGQAIGGLCARLASQCQATAQGYLRLDASARARFLQDIASNLHGSVSIENDLPARAKALLTTEVSKDVARDWLAMAGPVRASFRADDDLRTTLRQLSMLPDARRRAEANRTSDVQQVKALCQE